MKLKGAIFGVMLSTALAVPAFAHFQLVYTPEIAVERSADTMMKMVFTHPFSAGHTMSMGEPQQFYFVHQMGEGKAKKTDLQDLLKKITWTSVTNSGDAYEALIPRKMVRSMGDYQFVLVPDPYYEEGEEIYIQQITKTYMNVGGVPGNWNQPLGLKTEWVPLNKPYAVWTGTTFKAQLLKDGKPCPNHEVEVEYMNHAPEMETNSFAKEAFAQSPQSSFETMGVMTDDRGYVTFAIPKAGWWGFCGLGSGPDTEFNGKELSQDAVIWVKAVDM